MINFVIGLVWICGFMFDACKQDFMLSHNNIIVIISMGICSVSGNDLNVSDDGSSESTHHQAYLAL